MALTPQTLAPGKRIKKSARRVGRGNATQKGTTAGKGTKGQKARSGGRGGLKQKAFKSSLQKIPKVRGFKSIYPRMAVVTLATLNRVSIEEETITPTWLCQKGLIRDPSIGVKILCTGVLDKKITVKGCAASKSAVAAIEKAGGKVFFKNNQDTNHKIQTIIKL